VGPENERELILLDMGDILAMIRGRFGQGRHEGNSSPQLAQETRLEQPDQIQGMPTLSLCLGRSRSMTKLPPSWHLDISKKSCLLVKGTAFFLPNRTEQKPGFCKKPGFSLSLSWLLYCHGSPRSRDAKFPEAASLLFFQGNADLALPYHIAMETQLANGLAQAKRVALTTEAGPVK